MLPDASTNSEVKHIVNHWDDLGLDEQLAPSTRGRPPPPQISVPPRGSLATITPRSIRYSVVSECVDQPQLKRKRSSQAKSLFLLTNGIIWPKLVVPKCAYIMAQTPSTDKGENSRVRATRRLDDVKNDR